MNAATGKENNISWQFLDGSDLDKRQKESLDDICRRTGFVPQKLIGTSAWWGSAEIGAAHYSGQFHGKDAVLKIQGIKPETSEAFMIESFRQFNHSRLIRPPELYAHLPWDEDKRYEALILEPVLGRRVVNLPTNEAEVSQFYAAYADYRKNCLSSPWIDQPSSQLSQKIQENFAKWRQISFRLYPQHPLRQDDDAHLIDKAVAALSKRYQTVSPQFQHGHLSDADLVQKDNRIVILSNLYWSWKAPFYDAVFAYHWFIYHLADIPGISPEEIESQRDIWLEHIYGLVKGPNDLRMIRLALLERAAAGLNLDVLSLNPEKPVVKYLVNSTRTQVEKLTQELS